MTKLFRIALASLILLAGLPGGADDYLPPDLRALVEQLKSDVSNQPSNATNASTRANLMWRWLNAYALNGGYVPVNATQTLASVMGADKFNPAFSSLLDEVITEFVFLDEHPTGLGTLEADLGPYVAQRYATITQTYTVGNEPIQTGGGIMLARHFMPNFGIWQTTDPAAPHYVSIASSNNRVSFVASTVAMRGMHGGFRTTRPTLVFKVASGTLREGDTIKLIYGDQSQGSPGIMTPDFSSDRMPLPLYVAFNEGGQFLSLPIQPIKVIGQEIAGVAGFLPSILSPGEKFTLSIRAQDRFYNRAEGAIPNWIVKLNGDDWLTVDANDAITTTEVQLPEPGTYFITIESTDGTIKGRANPTLVSAEPRDRIYWGDTHGHSGFAEGVGTPQRFMEWARDDARLDYVTHSEHDIWLDDAEWEVLRENVRSFTDEGNFIAYLGYEWTVNNLRGGHHNVLFREPENRNRISAHFYPTLSKLYQGLRMTADPKDIVVIPHAHQAGDHRHSDPELEPLVEIMSQHGNFEWFGRMYLNHGHQVGFTAASDNHLSQPGYSAPLGGSLSQRGGLGAIMAAERTTDGIFNGMKSLRSYATTGDRIIVDFELNGAQMGQRTTFTQQRNISAKVIGTAPIDTITLVKNDVDIWQQSYLEDKISKVGKKSRFLLTFSSDSEPVHPGDNPRGWRTWQGTLKVLNADVVQITPYDSSFPQQSIRRLPDDPNQIQFSTKTRGDTSSFYVELENIQRTARLQFDLIEAPETGGAPPVYRAPQRIPATSFALSLRDIEQGRISYREQVDAYTDTVALRQIVDEGVREVDIAYVDESDRQGDYYYLRIVQANDAIAWSSPIWVGGHAHR